jgi:lipoprotein-anchoring transpeptidase ErfK/SrfK
MRSNATLSLIVAGSLAAVLAAAGPAHAQIPWSSDQPGYDSNAQQTDPQTEAERAERRKSYAPVVYPKFMQGGDRPDIQPAAPPIVYFGQQEEVGSIIVDTQNRKLYYVLPDKKAYEYPISVGRDGFTWSGTERISRIAAWPSWTPPPEMHKRIPGLPITVTGGLKNPQGARALYLGNTIYRIHGTNNDRTVGRANSSGCFRLTNENVVHLASIAKVGTKVKVLQSYNGTVAESAPLWSLFDWGGNPPPPKPVANVKPKKPAPKREAAASPASTAPATTGSVKAAPSTASATAAPASTTAAPAAKKAAE